MNDGRTSFQGRTIRVNFTLLQSHRIALYYQNLFEQDFMVSLTKFRNVEIELQLIWKLVALVLKLVTIV